MSAAVTTNMQRGQLLENETFAGASCFFLRESSGHSGCLLLAPREGWWPWEAPAHCLPGGSDNTLFTRGLGLLIVYPGDWCFTHYLHGIYISLLGTN